MVFLRWAFGHVSPAQGLAGHPRRRRLRAWPERADILLNVRMSRWLLPEPGEDSRCLVCRTFKEGAARVLRREGRVLGGRVPDPAPGRLLPTPSPLGSLPLGSCPAGPPGQTLDRTAPALSHRIRAEPLAPRPRLADREAGEGAPARVACSHPRGPRTFVVWEAGPFRGDALTGVPGRQVLRGSG